MDENVDASCKPSIALVVYNVFLTSLFPSLPLILLIIDSLVCWNCSMITRLSNGYRIINVCPGTISIMFVLAMASARSFIDVMMCSPAIDSLVTSATNVFV